MNKHGYYHGGRMRHSNFVNLDLMLGVTGDMEEICPDAWLIQSGNPVYQGLYPDDPHLKHQSVRPLPWPLWRT